MRSLLSQSIEELILTNTTEFDAVENSAEARPQHWHDLVPNAEKAMNTARGVAFGLTLGGVLWLLTVLAFWVLFGHR